ncbi:hypothetical protein LY90DRAFT_674028 [Neocallimastix californiae]|jgi:hypothetical protein|uniref:Inner centromere protein ARK-binding domain-containing protein n=1 Tax=Neocallimastix californiae TaxID=1754190 RepID=A0A1Y2B2X5_9FUNG|nr:hypothetical protein LY90DRAFT_674028 [Neocallimastix californiae]|eukprot:ORY28847.1 hypothetical protein LY90DRAFT_674028 [Neocallimastix californiae]
MTNTETIKIPYFLSKKILLFENIKNSYEVDFNESVDNELNWLNTQKSAISELLNTTSFNIIQKQITENIEPSVVTITNNLNAFSNNLKTSINKNDNTEIGIFSDVKTEIFEKPPPSLSDFTKNPITEVEKEIFSLNNDKPTINNKSNELTSTLNTLENKNTIYNHTKFKKTLSIESLNPLIEEIINKNTKNSINNRKNSLSKKESKSLNTSSINENEISNDSNHNSFLHNLKNAIENRNLIINKIENHENFKKYNDKSEQPSIEETSPDVITDFKRSLSNYTARKKKSTLTSINDTIDSSATLRNNFEAITLSPTTRLEDDTLGSTLNNNTIINIDVLNANSENKNKNKNPEIDENAIKKQKLFKSLLEEINIDPELLNIDLPNIKIENQSTEEKEKERNQSQIVSSFLDEIDKDEINKSNIHIYDNAVMDEFKDCDTDIEILNSHDLSKIKIENPDIKKFKNNNNNNRIETLFEKQKDMENKKRDEAEKIEKEEKRSVTTTAFNILTSPFNPFTHSHEKKLKFTTPDKNDINNNNEGSKKSVSERFKALWDSTTKGLHNAFSRNPSSSNSVFNPPEIGPGKYIASTSLSPSTKLYYSPEHESAVSSFINNKSTNFKNNKIDKNIKLKAGSSSVPSKNKSNLFSTDTNDFNINFKKHNTISFTSTMQSPSDSPLAFKSSKKVERKNNEINKFNLLNDNIFKTIDNDFESKSIFNSSSSSSPLFNKSRSNILKKSNSSSSYNENISQSPSKYFYSFSNNISNNKIPMSIDDVGKENKLKKSASDLSESSSKYREENKKEIASTLGSSWNIYGINNNKDQPSLIPKNPRLKKTIIKRPTKDKLKSLDSSRIIKKRELVLDKKQKIRLNAERHMLYLKKKREEEEKLAVEKQKDEEKKRKSDTNSKLKNRQKQLEVEMLIKKRNEKIKQVNEKKKALQSREVAKSILLNKSNIYKSNSILDKINSLPIDTNTVLKKKKNNNNIIKKSKISGIKNTSVLSNNTKISSIPKSKLIMGKSKSNLPSSSSSSSTSISSNNNININNSLNSNVSTHNILSGLSNNPPSKSINLGLNNLDEPNKNANTSIISISSSRSSTTPYKGTILQDGEFPDIPSDNYSDEDDSRASLVATWAKTPNLLKELEKQKNINPDDIFGGYRPCNLDEIFKGSHFKRHTSNENWADSSILHDDE